MMLSTDTTQPLHPLSSNGSNAESISNVKQVNIKLNIDNLVAIELAIDDSKLDDLFLHFYGKRTFQWYPNLPTSRQEHAST